MTSRVDFQVLVLTCRVLSSVYPRPGADRWLILRLEDRAFEALVFPVNRTLRSLFVVSLWNGCFVKDEILNTLYLLHYLKGVNNFLKCLFWWKTVSFYAFFFCCLCTLALSEHLCSSTEMCVLIIPNKNIFKLNHFELWITPDEIYWCAFCFLWLFFWCFNQNVNFPWFSSARAGWDDSTEKKKSLQTTTEHECKNTPRYFHVMVAGVVSCLRPHSVLHISSSTEKYVPVLH